MKTPFNPDLNQQLIDTHLTRNKGDVVHIDDVEIKWFNHTCYVNVEIHGYYDRARPGWAVDYIKIDGDKIYAPTGIVTGKHHPCYG